LSVRSATGCGIEINHVEPREAIPKPPTGDAQWVVDTDALRLIIATHELDTCPLAQVDRWDHDHRAAASRNARTKRTPSRELFSGCNGTPTVRPCLTSAGNRSAPWVLHARTTSDESGRPA